MSGHSQRSFIVSIIGRPNVGKSSIFNRLMRRQHKALTHDTPGVTRDRHYGLTTLDEISMLPKRDIILVDTGGFYPEQIDESQLDQRSSTEAFFNIMADHAKVAIEESDLVLFVVDVREGLNPFDEMVANFIRRAQKPMWLLANKYDSDAQAGDETDFYSLGINSDELFCISASHGLGVRSLKEFLHRQADEFSKKLVSDRSEAMALQKGVSPREQVVSRVALIGAPNAGKSTLLNQLVGAQRALVSDIPGTTVDPIEGFFDLYFGKDVEVLENTEDIIRHDNHLIEQYESFRSNNTEVYQQMLNSYEGNDALIENSSSEGEEIIEQWDINEQELERQQLADEQHLGEKLQEKLFSESEPDSDGETADQADQGGSLWRSVHLVDTAGIRKKSRIDGPIESQSVYRSLRCITESDIVIFMVDATIGIGHQDRRLMDVAIEKGKSLIVCLNKMDLLKEQLKTQRDRREWLEDLRYKVPWLHYCDLLTISAKKGSQLKKLKAVLKKTILVRRQRIPTGELNKAFLELAETNPITLKKSGGKRFKVKYASMVKTAPPTFLLFCNRTKGIPENYRRYLKNGLRRSFVLDNTPIHLIFRKGGELERRMKKVSERP